MFSKHVKMTSKYTSKMLKKGKKHDRKNHVPGNDYASDSNSSVGSEHDPESDVECVIPLKDMKSIGRTITHCSDMFCDVEKAVHLVMLLKQAEGDFEDEDMHHARKQALEWITLQMLAHYKKVYYILIYEIPSIKTLINNATHASTLKKILKKICICIYIVVLRTG
ncbi:hypothetical protein J3R82DRAFT_10190 [Butyriboletus roseoflavus]|nr:hypothetical protein J3R82DRAFT_10190 [Butyriboletus roseoflavus]